MSHTRRKTAKTGSKIKILYIGTLFLCLFTILDVLTGTASAATHSETRIQKRPTYILKSTLADLTNQDKAVLDWQSRSFELSFDLPAHDWYENLNLFLSAYPEGHVSRTAPLMISYNGAPAIPLHGRGSQFDAQIRLDPNRIRSSHNSVIISYKTPPGADCLNAEHGQWVLNLSRSKLVATARSKPRNMHISEIEPRLAHPMTAPKRVAILAKGNSKFALEALAAQGISQRMSTLPNFQFSSAASDLTLVIGTPDKIRPFVNNKGVLVQNNINIFVDTGPRPKLVLTAPTEAQVLELTRAFARFHLPQIRRTNTTLQALYMGLPLSSRPTLEADKYTLSSLGDTILMPSWRPAAAHVEFNVEDAQSSSGLLVLNIITGPETDPNSRVNVRLNGQSIGYTNLNKTSKNVSFDIRPNLLKSVGNTLSIQSVLVKGPQKTVCAAMQTPPTVMISGRSKLTIQNPASTPLTDLSRFAASGAPFNTRADTTVVLTARSAKDRASTLRFLAFAAQQFGPQWTLAEYKTTMPDQSERDTNILIIGPHIQGDSQLIASAPRALKLALQGKAIQSPNAVKMASLGLQASLHPEQAFKMAARLNQEQSRVRSGGIASLFPSPYAKGRLIGVISATSPAQFSNAMQAASRIEFWNALQGSVMRWDKNTALMAQTAAPLPKSFGLIKENSSLKNRFQRAQRASAQWFNKLLPNQKSTPAKLRGAVKLDISAAKAPHTRAAVKIEKTAGSLAIINRFKTSAEQRFLALKTSISQTHSPKFIAQSTSIHGFTEGLRDLYNNRAAWLFFLALAAFFIIGKASPKAN